MKIANAVFARLIWCLLFFVIPFAQAAPLRRPVSPNQPMWLVHIDTWNTADPQKIIDLIPADIRPYVVMNISLSISHNAQSDPGRFNVVEYGYETAKSWIRTCAQNRMWCMVQPSSGGFSHLSDFDMSQYEEFFQDYPNFLGFNYSEQFWGFDLADDNPPDPLSAFWVDRINHFADVLALCDQYGGYLVVSWAGNQFSPNINPIGMLKRNPTFAQACRDHTQNYILEEKYTQPAYQSDMESLCLGAYLSGYSGNYGVRYDETGWTDGNGSHTNFTMASAGAPHFEHMLMDGATVIDAPELVWAEDFKENSAGATDNGYTKRNFATFARFDNEMVDIFRKILDGTVRIPTRQEVISRTKFVIINDVNSGSADNQYSSPIDLFNGLYKMDNDGTYANNRSVWKKTGRYPTIPTVFGLEDSVAQSFQFQVLKSGYSNRWANTTAKVNEFNTQFPSEYSGTMYARRLENQWVTYNPFKLIGVTASGSIPFKYNTCDHMDLTYSTHTTGVIKETSNQVKFYLANYDDQVSTGLQTDTIKVFGASSQPSFSWADRGSHQASSVSSSWSGGVFTLTVQHNGSLDITVNCSGTGTGRLTTVTPPNLISPAQPAVYNGPRQYEGEFFDYKNITGITKNGHNGSLRNYTGQGYVGFGTSSTAAVRSTTVNVPSAGTYNVQVKYSVGATVNTVDLYVNGTLVSTPVFASTGTNWGVNEQAVSLNTGSNTIELRAHASGASAITFDNMVVQPATIFFEAEALTVASNTAPFHLGADPSMSGDNGLFFDATGANQSITVAVPGIEAVTYDVRVGVKKANNRGIFQNAIAGSLDGAYSNHGAAQDNYSASTTYTEVDIGNVTFGSDGTKFFRFTITGKNASSTGYSIGFDYIKLIPQ